MHRTIVAPAKPAIPEGSPIVLLGTGNPYPHQGSVLVWCQRQVRPGTLVKTATTYCSSPESTSTRTSQDGNSSSTKDVSYLTEKLPWFRGSWKAEEEDAPKPNGKGIGGILSKLNLSH